MQLTAIDGGKARPVVGTIERDAFRLAEVMARVPIGRTKLYEEVASGRLKTFKVGRAVLVYREDYERWIAKLRGNEAPAAA